MLTRRILQTSRKHYQILGMSKFRQMVSSFQCGQRSKNKEKYLCLQIKPIPHIKDSNESKT